MVSANHDLNNDAFPPLNYSTLSLQNGGAAIPIDLAHSWTRMCVLWHLVEPDPPRLSICFPTAFPARYFLEFHKPTGPKKVTNTSKELSSLCLCNYHQITCMVGAEITAQINLLVWGWTDTWTRSISGFVFSMKNKSINKTTNKRPMLHHVPVPRLSDNLWVSLDPCQFFLLVYFLVWKVISTLSELKDRIGP